MTEQLNKPNLVDRIKATIQFVEVYKHHVHGFTEISKNSLIWLLQDSLAELEDLKNANAVLTKALEVRK